MVSLTSRCVEVELGVWNTDKFGNSFFIIKVCVRAWKLKNLKVIEIQLKCIVDPSRINISSKKLFTDSKNANITIFLLLVLSERTVSLKKLIFSYHLTRTFLVRQQQTQLGYTEYRENMFWLHIVVRLFFWLLAKKNIRLVTHLQNKNKHRK